MSRTQEKLEKRFLIILIIVIGGAGSGSHVLPSLSLADWCAGAVDMMDSAERKHRRDRMLK